MSDLAWKLARPLLFRFDPEEAHHLGLKLGDLASCLPATLRPFPRQRVEDPIELMGLRFPSRVGLAAGLDKNAAHIDSLAALGFGFLELGTVTPLPQPGNPRPRLFRLPQAEAIINRFGFNNDGLDTFTANVKRSATWKRRQHGDQGSTPPPILGLNIGKNAVTPLEEATGDYVKGLRAVMPLADYIAINISSPNTANLRKLQGAGELDGLLGALAAERDSLAASLGRNPPLLLKIAPDLDDTQLSAIIDALQRHRLDGVVATNTTLSRDAVKGLPHAEEAGGLSGKPVAEASNRIIRALRAGLPKGFPIIGVGGVMRPADALEKIRAGADLVQLYSGLVYGGPALITGAARIIHDNDDTMRRTL
ncbi:MAG: quinone-dependent dihydroorotate dehydrogenase [Lautropia sp.]|nr:quinone-dependent dihydroorotate dehydrogenase [Lautropia sp.]